MENTNNNTQPDYLNPESPKYYKGYKLTETKENGIERWYDENGNLRKVIFYYDNGNKTSEWYYNEKCEFHNEDGYAYQEWDYKGEIINQEYRLNGEKIDKYEWEVRTNK